MNLDLSVRYSVDHRDLCFRHAVEAANDGDDVTTSIEIDYYQRCDTCQAEYEEEYEAKRIQRNEEEIYDYLRQSRDMLISKWEKVAQEKRKQRTAEEQKEIKEAIDNASEILNTLRGLEE